MYILKTILLIYSIPMLLRAIDRNNVEKGIDAIMIMLLALLIQPII